MEINLTTEMAAQWDNLTQVSFTILHREELYFHPRCFSAATVCRRTPVGWSTTWKLAVRPPLDGDDGRKLSQSAFR